MLTTTMRACLLSLLLVGVSLAQVSSPASTPNVPQNPPTGQPPMQPMPNQLATLEPLLGQLQRVSTSTVSDLGRLRVDKWKTDSTIKQQNETNVDSIQRNLTTALPSLIDQVRTAPGNLPPALKLYRNLNVLCEVLASVAESAGAFGPRQDYESLARNVNELDQVRKLLADRLENLATAQEAELSRLQAVIRAQAAQAAAAPPKHIVVDDTTPAQKKTSPKKPVRKPDAAGSTPK